MSSSKDLVFASLKYQTRVFSLVSQTCFSFLASAPVQERDIRVDTGDRKESLVVEFQALVL